MNIPKSCSYGLFRYTSSLGRENFIGWDVDCREIINQTLAVFNMSYN